MNPFQYATASTPDEAISLLGTNGRYLGGGIDLLGEMKEFIVTPDLLVDVKGITAPPPADKTPGNSATDQATISPAI